MTKKDYELIALGLSLSQPTVKMATDNKSEWQCHRYQWQNTVSYLADKLEDTNPRFDRSRFLNACGLTAEFKDETIALD